VKNFTKLTLTTLAIAACFAACTKDNSVKTSQPAVNFSSKGATELKHDTITPQVKKTTASPQVSRDTITPR
jgi:predicted S18 family serine protease